MERKAYAEDVVESSPEPPIWLYSCQVQLRAKLSESIYIQHLLPKQQTHPLCFHTLKSD